MIALLFALTQATMVPIPQASQALPLIVQPAPSPRMSTDWWSWGFDTVPPQKCLFVSSDCAQATKTKPCQVRVAGEWPCTGLVRTTYLYAPNVKPLSAPSPKPTTSDDVWRMKHPVTRTDVRTHKIDDACLSVIETCTHPGNECEVTLSKTRKCKKWIHLHIEGSSSK